MKWFREESVFCFERNAGCESGKRECTRLKWFGGADDMA